MISSLDSLSDELNNLLSVLTDLISLSIDQQIKIIDTVINTSLVLLGIIGAWISVLLSIYYAQKIANSDPNSITNLLTDKKGNLFIPLRNCIYSILSSIFIKIILVCIDKTSNNYILIPFSILSISSALFLGYTIITCLFPFDVTKSFFRDKKNKCELDERFHG